MQSTSSTIPALWLALLLTGCGEDEKPLLPDSGEADTDTDTDADLDADGDGYGADDCDDGDPAINPGADELCNGIDDDCDGAIDEAEAADASTWYADADGDGYGDPAITTTACDRPSGWVAESGDCDDADPERYPGAAAVVGEQDPGCHGWDAITIVGHENTADAGGLGRALAAADFDGDGLDDLVMSEIGAGAVAGPDAGAVVILPGASLVTASEHDVALLPTIPGTFAKGYFGHQLAAVDDRSGDGVPELAATSLEGSGGVHLYLGRSDWSGLSEDRADLEIVAVEQDRYLGVGLVGADLDGDGLGDLVTGAYQSSVAGFRSGAVYLFDSGAATGSITTADADLAWFGDGDRITGFGYALTAIGDQDGDGTTDLLITAPSASGSFDGAGQAMLYTDLSAAIASGTAPAPFATIQGDGEGLALGVVAGGVGDVDADGSTDLVLGAAGLDLGSDENAGIYYLFEGGAVLAGTHAAGEALASWYGSDLSGEGMSQGAAVRAAGDLDADGADDFLLGVPGDHGLGLWAGRMAVVFGGSRADWGTERSLTEADQVLDAPEDGAMVGSALVGDADFDGDGRRDFAVGAFGLSKVFVYLNHPEEPQAEPRP